MQWYVVVASTIMRVDNGGAGSKLILVTCGDPCDFHIEAMRVVLLVFGMVATEQAENKLCCSEEVSIFETDQEVKSALYYYCLLVKA